MDSNSKILLITNNYLHGNGGACFASRAFINAFAELFNDVTLLYPIKDSLESQFINPKVKQIPVSYNKSKLGKLWDLMMGCVHRYSNISQLIGNIHFDLVVFDTSVVSFKLLDYFKSKGSKTIVIHHNYQYEYFRDNTTFPISVPTLYWCKRYEGEAVKKADLNLTLTSQDIDLLKLHYGIGRFAKLGTFEYKQNEHLISDKPYSQSHPTFVITGSLSDAQTYKSLAPWFDTCYPELRKLFPDSQLTLAGRGPAPNIDRITSDLEHVNIIYNPDSMDDILNQADIYLCPTSLGGGLKLRIMDGLSHGLPVITHKVSARGYDSFEKQGYLFSYSSPTDFEAVLEKIKGQSFDKKKIIDFYNTQFSFNAGVERLRNILLKQHF